ncbi:MAG: CBS domain-containing protein [Candidatus Omnitrophica bacterium]|nr:CBS domain-containing protein [Candidatus Omnitrophota bacterium]
MQNLLLKDIMTKDPVTLNIDEPFCRVAQIFQERDIRHLPIVNSQGMILGIISQRDLNRIASPKKGPNGEYLYDPEELSKYILKQHVIQKVFSLSPEGTLEKAVELMAEKKLGCMPVASSDGKVVGIVTITDILKLFLKSLRGEN